MTIGDRIREARERRKWTRRKLSELCGYTQGSILDWEHDRHVPSERAIAALEEALGVKLHEEAP